jgi:3-dehydroquinate synthetase
MLADVVFTFFSLLFRFASDQLEHGYAVSVSNVFDTMLADVVFTNWAHQAARLQKYARSYNVRIMRRQAHAAWILFYFFLD